MCFRTLRTPRWRWLALFTALAAAPGTTSMLVAGEGPPVYEIYYKHLLKNTTKEPLEHVRVYLPIPQTVPCQEVRNYQIELWGQDFATTEQRDEFGQPLVRITIPTIPALEQVEVGFSCDAVLRKVAPVELQPDNVGTLADIPAEIRATYTANVESIYNLTDPDIQELARGFKAQHANLLERMLAIHDFVAGEVTYARGGGWDAAPKVLRRKSGSCSEFTFLFCALCRAADLPTRMVGASKLRRQVPPTYHDTIWHRWAEVYLPPHGWVPVDPTADLGQPPRRTYVGAQNSDVLVVTRLGGGGTFGKQYLGANSHYRQLRRERVFVWSRGARDAFVKADALAQRAPNEACEALRSVARSFRDTKWGRLAKSRLDELKTGSRPTTRANDPESERLCRSWLTLARTLARNGDAAAARKYYKRIADKYPNSTQAATAREELDKLQP
ncbi:MAG: hypothetical protein KKB50_05340 [Planctomycetes bacterium]|nr:hypothetical protein [Planctomycetota bacterium]